MKKPIVSVLVSVILALALLSVGAAPASALVQREDGALVQPAQPEPVPVEPIDVPEPVDPVPVEPEPIAPLPWGSVHLKGDVFANGAPIGPIDFAILWNEDDPSEAQLWALLGDLPTQVCVGRIFDTPGGEPIFFGSTPLLEPEGTCYMSRLPDHSGIALFAASNDGQWAAAILTHPNQVEPVPIFD